MKAYSPGMSCAGQHSQWDPHGSYCCCLHWKSEKRDDFQKYHDIEVTLPNMLPSISLP